MLKFFVSIFVCIMFCVCPLSVQASGGVTKAPVLDPLVVFKKFEGIPYRDDGAIDREGNYTLFANQTATFKTPGLNCSGFTVAASRILLKEDFSLSEVMKDINNDSGPDAVLGQDWDFGYDLLLNLANGRQRKVMMPSGHKVEISPSDGMTLRGFALHDREAWKDIFSQMKTGMIYLFSLSKPVHFKNYKLIHHHVGLLAKGNDGRIYLCHATRKGGVNIIDMSSDAGLDSFLAVRPEKKFGDRMILMVETPTGMR